MRAVCEACDVVQPSDWKPGDLCSACGLVARRELRCHWCAEFTPEGRFCRACGAETVVDELYAPARMLKAAGVDQFSIGERLRALDDDHVAHLTRMYQRQAALVAQNVDELRWVEGFLRGGGWAQELDDALTSRLPMAEAEVEAVLGKAGRPSLRGADAAVEMRSIISTTPVAITSLLAAVAVVRNGWVSDADQVELAESGLHSQDRRVLDEAALAFGHWRSRFAPVRFVSEQKLIGALSECSFREDAIVALRLLGQDDEVDPRLLADEDPDRSFAAALALGTHEPLTAALADSQRRRAAGLVLAANGHAAPLGPFFVDFDDDTLSDILALLHRNRVPYPMLRSELWTVAKGRTRDVRRNAASLLVTIGQPGDALGLLDLDIQDQSNVQDVLQRMAIEGPDLLAVCRHLVEARRFRLSQYGVQDLAEKGRVPDDFVPSVWGRAADDEQRRDLLRFAEEQLAARSNEALHRWVLNVVFSERGSLSAVVREEAWWSLLRWYGRSEYASKGPLAFDASVIAKYFSGGVAEFVDRFLVVLLDPDTAEHRTLEECVGTLLRYSPEAGLPSIVAEQAAFARLVEGLQRLLSDDSRRSSLRGDVVRFLENNVRADRTLLDRVVAILSPFERDDLAFEVSTTLARLRGE